MPNPRSRTTQTATWLAAVVMAWAITTPAAHARQAGDAQVIGVVILPIVALAVETAGEAVESGAVRRDAFALTSNRDATSLVARLDEALPTGVNLFVTAETDLATGSGERSVGDGTDVILLAGLARGARRNQSLLLRAEGTVTGDIVRNLSVGLVDASSGAESWQMIPVTIRAR